MDEGYKLSLTDREMGMLLMLLMAARGTIFKPNGTKDEDSIGSSILRKVLAAFTN